MGIDRCLDPNPILARVRPTLANRSHRVLTTEDTTATRQLPSSPSSERTDGSGSSGPRRRTPVGDSLNDEQWSNDLSVPPSYETTGPRVRDVGKHELNLSEDREGQIRDFAFGSHRSNGEQRAHSEKSTRLDEDRGNGLVQSTDSGPRPRGSANRPAVQDEPEDNHKGEGDVE